MNMRKLIVAAAIAAVASLGFVGRANAQAPWFGQRPDDSRDIRSELSVRRLSEQSGSVSYDFISAA